MDKKRVLLICYDYWPIGSPHAYRWSAIAEQWVEHGHQVDVVALGKPGLPSEECIRGVRVYRAGGQLMEKWRTRLTSAGAGASSSNGMNLPASNKTRSTLKHIGGRWLRVMHDSTWKKLYWPDYACLWQRHAVRQAEALYRQAGYDYLVSVSHPFTCHLIAQRMKRNHPDITWLVDVGDPFCLLKETPTNNHALYKRKNVNAEGEVFGLADAIGITPEAIASYKALFPKSAHKMHVIPPMLSMKMMLTAAEAPRRMSQGQVIKLVFIGTLYRSIRNPQTMLQLFESMLQTSYGEQLQLHVYGNLNDCRDLFTPYEALISDKIIIHGVVEHHIALQAMREADILINISNRTPLQLPSKVVEYASTGNRILNLTELESDASAAFYASYPAAITVNQNTIEQLDHEQLLQQLLQLPLLEGEALQAWMKPYLLESISKQFYNLLSTQAYCRSV